MKKILIPSGRMAANVVLTIIFASVLGGGELLVDGFLHSAILRQASSGGSTNMRATHSAKEYRADQDSGSWGVDIGNIKEPIRAHGRHICLDFTGFVVDAQAGAEMTLRFMRQAADEAGVREVHAKVVVLGEDGASPPGFTAVVLIDESHVTAHCYSDRGWLAIDVFTCGSHPPERIAQRLEEQLLHNTPGLRIMKRTTLDRFLYAGDRALDCVEPPRDVVHV